MVMRKTKWVRSDMRMCDIDHEFSLFKQHEAGFYSPKCWL